MVVYQFFTTPCTPCDRSSNGINNINPAFHSNGALFFSTNPANDVADLANDNIEWQLTLNPKYQNNTEHNELDEAKSYQHNDFKGKTRFAAGRRE